MGRRDYRWREPKKPKKSATKPIPTIVLTPPVSVEVIKKGKKAPPTEG